MAKEMLINVSEGEECRIALLEDGRLEELYMERTSSTSHVGNIYKGKVANVEASIQAAFVDFGMGRNGFLHISDLMPTYFGRKGEDIVETVGKKMARRDRPPIQRCLRRGDEIIVQIIKEGIGTKGPTLSSYLSIPGKHLVMMPGVGKMGVSQKIEDEVERRRLRQILDGLKPPKDVGFIIRTAGVGKSKLEIERDLKYLVRLWEQIERKRTSSKGPTELYAEGDLVTRTVRDFFSAEIDRIIIDNAEVADRVTDVIKITTPRAKNKVELYEDPVPMFHKFGIEREIELMYSRHVPLPSGGSLVIDSTEAIVAIDVNSGKFRDHSDAETTAFKTDMEAADEIPRQLKLRDLGGVIICDFIDLRYERNRRELEKRLHDNFKKDRAKTKVLRMSQFGIIELTRQRMRPSFKRSIYFDCPHCKGAGLVKTPESMSLDVMRRIAIAINDLKVARVELAVCPDVAFYLQNKKRRQLVDLESHFNKRVLVKSDSKLGLDEMKLELFDSRDGLVVLPDLDVALAQPGHKTQLNTKPHGRQQPPQKGGGGRLDPRRDHGRRGPQVIEQPREMGEDDDERFNEDEIEEAANESHEPEQSDDHQEHEARDDRQDRPARDDRQDRQQRDDRGDRGNRRPQQQPPQNQQRRQDQGRQQQHPQQRSGGNEPQRQGQGRPGDRDRAMRDDRQPPQQRGGGGGNQPAADVQQNRGPDGEGAPMEFNEDGTPRKKRRRRRGRRGRGRGRQEQEGQAFQQGPADPNAPRDQRDEFADADDHDSEEHHDEMPESHEEMSEIGEAPAEISDDRETESSFDREPSANEPEPATEEVEREAELEAEEPAPAAKPSRKRGSQKKPAAGTKAEKPAPAEKGAKSRRPARGAATKARATRSRKPPAANAAAETSTPARETPAAPAPRARRSGSADKHLIDDEPIIPDPPRRPRSSRDLDEIPDDLD